MKLLIAILFITSSSWAADFSVKSKAYQEGKTIEAANVFNSFGCTGKNVSPDIEWKNAPKDTKSFAVTIYDPDAPTGSGWWHWTIFNIPASVHKISAGASPKSLPKGAIEGHTDFGSTGYGGPCPPAGDKPHHYILTVFALKTEHLDLDSSAPGAMLGFYLSQNTLAKTQVTALFGRKDTIVGVKL